MRKRDAARHPLNGKIARRAVDCVWRRTGLGIPMDSGACCNLCRLSNSLQSHTHSSPCLCVSVVNLLKSALVAKDSPANPVELLKLDALGSVATVGSVETSTTDQEGGRAADVGFASQLFQQTSLGCVKPQGATEASHGWALSNLIVPNEA